MFRKSFAALLAVVVLALSALGVHAQEVAPAVDQTLFMTFIPNIQFAPIYVGLGKGYFSEAGINLSVEYGDEPVGVDLIAANQRQFGIVSGEEVIKARANGRPIVGVYEWFQQYPIGIVVPEGSGIESMADLAGRKVGIPGRFGASFNGLIALLSANGMTESDIQLEPIGFNAPDVFCIGQVEAAVVYINNEPLQIQNRIAAGDCNDYTGVQVFPVSEALDLVSNMLVTNEETLAGDPQLVQEMVTAFDHALRDTINNPAEAYLLSADYVENLPLSEDFKSALETASVAQGEFLLGDPTRIETAESRSQLLDDLSVQFGAETLLQFQVLLNTIQLWDADQLGYTSPDSWVVTQDVLTTSGILTTSTDLETAFTNDFLPSAEG
jgi:NitT/TauT family transport system substrate-binding protein